MNQTNYDKIADAHAKYSLDKRPYDRYIINTYLLPTINQLIESNNWNIYNILSYWCGNTWFEKYLLDNISTNDNISIIAVDISEESIKEAKKQQIYENILYQVINSTASNLNNILTTSIDYVSAIYVLDVIKEDITIQNSLKNIYNTLNKWWVMQIIIWLPEDFYGKECPDFSFPYKHDQNDQIINKLSHGEEYPVILWDITTNLYIEVTDFYREMNTISTYLTQSWFTNIKIQKIYAPKDLKDPRDLSIYPWSAVITAMKE